MTKAANNIQAPGSFRDPSGFLFWQGGTLYRQVNVIYGEEYDYLMNSGLYEALVSLGLLLPHKEVEIEPPRPDIAYKVIRPEAIQFVSYPYCWCFSQLKDAALTTLRVQKMCLDFGMSLKDSSAFNIQFTKGNPVLIDSLSFERYSEGQPWVAYRQFCQHFLAPLALMSYKDVRLNQLFRIYIDGVPLDLASSLLPFPTRLSFPLLSHIHLHAKSQKHFANRTVDVSSYKMSRRSFLGIVSSLESVINKLKWQPSGTEWAEYYEDINYSTVAFQHKKQLVAEYLERIKPAIVWDLGANVGVFSRLASDCGIQTISFDVDPAVVEKTYLHCREKGETHLLPLIIDLTNPSPCLGWENKERMSMVERGPADAVIALALAHHLAISNNLPLGYIARFLAAICLSLIIEFVPKEDSQVQKLLATREDIFPDYNRQAFEKEFSCYFTIEDSAGISESQRILYLMRRKQK